VKIWSKNGSEENDAVVEEFLAGEDILCDQELVQLDAKASIAHARMLGEISVLSENEVKSLVAGLEEVIELDKKGEFKLDPELEDVHSNIEAYLTEKLGSVGKKLHTGRSRNDQVATLMLLYSKQELEETIGLAGELCKVLLKKAEENNHPMPGYTHMQPAMPSTLKHLLLGYCENILWDVELLLAVKKMVDYCPLGACAGYGTIADLKREKTAKSLAFNQVHLNSISAVSSRGKNEFAIVSAVSALALDLSKIAEDMLLFSTKEFGFVSFSGKIATGSSVMPQKKNYDVFELLRAKSAVFLGLQTEIYAVSKSLPSGYNRDAQLTKPALMKAFKEVKTCLKVAAKAMSSLEANPKKMKAACTPEIFAADNATLKAVEQGIPFREAYKQVGNSEYAVFDLSENISKKKSLGSPGDETITKKLGEKLLKHLELNASGG